MKKVYFISGLGADETVFDKLDLSFCKPVFLQWIPPLKSESLQHYAFRLSKKIEEPGAIIIGLSMGGMMASEIAMANPSMKAIIISSNRTADEFPWYSRFAIRYIPLYKLVNHSLLKLISPITCWFMSAVTKEEKKRLQSLINKSDVSFIKWCIGAIGRRKRMNDIHKNIIHIHGTADRLLPFRKVKADHVIQNGGHLMIRNNAKEISEILRRLIC